MSGAPGHLGDVAALAEAGAARLLVLSDTHARDAARLPDAVLELAAAADLVVHAGDHSVLEVPLVLARLAPVLAVHGNVDEPEVVQRLPLRAHARVAGVDVHVVHDAGAAAGRPERLRELVGGAGLAVYGHSHQPELLAGDERSAWVLNPGSPLQRRRAPTHTVAWVELGAGRVQGAELVHLDGP